MKRQIAKDFELPKTLSSIHHYIDAHHEPNKDTKKVFYQWYEWSGWRFYVKAITHRDWKSLISHIREHLTPPKQ